MSAIVTSIERSTVIAVAEKQPINASQLEARPYIIVRAQHVDKAGQVKVTSTIEDGHNVTPDLLRTAADSLQDALDSFDA